MTPGLEDSHPTLDLNSKCSLWVTDSEDDGVVNVVHFDNDVFGNNILISDIPSVVDYLNSVYLRFGNKEHKKESDG